MDLFGSILMLLCKLTPTQKSEFSTLDTNKVHIEHLCDDMTAIKIRHCHSYYVVVS